MRSRGEDFRDESTILEAMLRGQFDLKIQQYLVNNVERDWMYFLVDGIDRSGQFSLARLLVLKHRSRIIFVPSKKQSEKTLSGLLVYSFSSGKSLLNSITGKRKLSR
jgi:hypothetical protein